MREYSRIQKISPPTASKLLERYHCEKILKKEEDRNYIYYFADKTSSLFIGLSRTYWHTKLKESGIIDYFEKELLNPVIIIFGSLSKAEVCPKSDIDLAIFTVSKKNIDTTSFERKLKRRIQLFTFKTRDDVKNKNLLNNILNGHKITGSW